MVEPKLTGVQVEFTTPPEKEMRWFMLEFSIMEYCWNEVPECKDFIDTVDQIIKPEKRYRMTFEEIE